MDAIIICVSMEYGFVLRSLHPTLVEGSELYAAAVPLTKSHHALWMTLSRTEPNRSEHAELRMELCAMMLAGCAIRGGSLDDVTTLFSVFRSTILLSCTPASLIETWQLAKIFADRFGKLLPEIPPLPT
jgi:hypothetical protein